MHGMKALSAAAALLVVVALSAAAEEKRLLVSSAFADSSIVAPAARYEAAGDGRSWAAAVTGWTIDLEWAREFGATRALRLAADATPLNAHNSNLMYAGGKRESSLDYDNASYRLRGGIRFTPNARSTTDVMVVALKEQVDGLAPAIEERWSSAYGGMELAHRYAIENARQPLIGAFDGIEISARGEVMAGNETWSRVMIVQRAGRDVGSLHLRQSLTWMNGSALDVVNRFLVGGSWDALGGTAIYGLRYGELRVARGVIGSGGADVRLGRGWTVGVRGSYIDADTGSTYGHALNATKSWKTVGTNFGVGISESSDSTIYAALIVPLYHR